MAARPPLQPLLHRHPLMLALQERIGYRFRRRELLEEALTHPSLGKKASNQRLEFLGDAVLGLVAANMLFALYPTETEGALARRHAALVRGETLSGVARGIGLGEALHMAAHEASSGGRENHTNLEDACEALLGALYLDGGLEAVEPFILKHWKPLAEATPTPPKDAKTSLQEWAQGRGLPVPSYTVAASEGPAHAPVFTVEVRVEGHAPARGTAPSKRAAEQAAATALLGLLGGQ